MKKEERSPQLSWGGSHSADWDPSKLTAGPQIKSFRSMSFHYVDEKTRSIPSQDTVRVGSPMSVWGFFWLFRCLPHPSDVHMR